MFVKIIKSISGKQIRLTEERWQHIKERHPEVNPYLNKVLATVGNPDVITSGWEEELVAIRKISDQDLAVIYKETKTEGFVITAFFTRSRKYFERRGIVWSKQS